MFNWLAGRRLAIVDDRAGVTRDRMMTLIEHRGSHFELIDTGGMGFEDTDNLTDQVEAQIEAAIQEAHLLLLVMDVRSGLASLDEEVVARLRKQNKPLLLVANKADHLGLDAQADEFRRLGFPDLLPVSTQQNRNREDLLDWIEEHLPDLEPDDRELEPAVMKITIVGRRNVGKSTFVNALAQSERMIVSEVPGTTRDSVDVHFELDGQKFIAIDTPGLRRNRSVKTDIDWYGMHRAQRSIRRSDVTLLLFDCMEPVSRVDLQLAHYIVEQYKPCILVVNKWDLLAGKIPTEDWVDYLRKEFPLLAYCPIAFITGQTGKNVKTLINHSQMLFKQSQQRVTTGQLNRLVQQAIQGQPPPLYQLKRPKIFYATQVST
ncbi:MAG: ribosome biogenesis GTPase Der, partial [Pirellulaceae bacterium]